MQDYRGSGTPAVQSISGARGIELNPLMRLVYMWMGLGLAVTAVVALFIASNEQLLFSISGLWLPIILVQLGLVIGLSWGINKLSPTMATTLFFVYAGTMGLTMGVLLYVVAESPAGTSAIASAFVTTAGLFGAMTVVGFTTKTDLSRFSTYFMMALIGLVIAMVINMFMQSGPLGMLISVVGVILFTALTAYDTQKIKQMSEDPALVGDQVTMQRLAIMGALTLYLDFINLFIFLLRLFSSRD